MKIGKWIAAGVMLLCGTVTAQAQDYPNRPITLIVPFAAAGPGDIIARLVADAMRRSLGQEVIVVNVGGAGGTIGTTRVAQAISSPRRSAPRPSSACASTRRAVR